MEDEIKKLLDAASKDIPKKENNDVEEYTDGEVRPKQAETEEKKEEEKNAGKKEEKHRRKIIYVDDLNYHLITAQQRLKAVYEVYPAQSSEVLFDILERITPELILLDINMPEIDGYEVIKQLKEKQKFKEIPVIFLTGNSDKKSIVRALELGAVDFIIKPYTAKEVIDSIEYQLDEEVRKSIKPSILAVDDDPSILQAINELLHEDYIVYTVPGVGSDKALAEILKKLTPDLFLLDCNMPGLSGIEIVQVIHDIPYYEGTPIIFLTADGSRDNVYVAMSENVNGFIVKPIDQDILYEKMTTLLKDFMKLRRIRSVSDPLDRNPRRK